MRFHLPATAAIIIGALCLSGQTGAQQSQPQRPPIFRAGIDIVQIDVTVLGRDGRPMHGLQREDFTLLEDGEPQPILGFGEVNIPDAADGPAWLRDGVPDVRTAMDGRVFVFFLDDYTTPDDLKTKARIETVKRIANEVIDRMGPTDVAAVVCVFEKRCAQDFTNNRGLLKAAVARFFPKQFPLGFSYDWSRHSAGDAGKVLQNLTERAGRRKAIIYVSAREPNRPEIWPPPVMNGLEANVSGQQMIRTFEDAMRARVTVYTLNTAGLLPLGEDSTGLSLSDGSSHGGKQEFVVRPYSLSGETGGFSVRSPAQFVEGVAQIFRETGSYYLLGYELPPKKNTGYNMLGGFRDIEVRVSRPGLIVKTHRGYIDPKAEKPPSTPPSPGDLALAGILPKTDLALRVAVAPFVVRDAKSGKLVSTVAIVLGIREPAPTERVMERLDVQVRAFTQRGDPRGVTTQQTSVTLSAARTDEVTFEVLSEMRLKPGVYALRLSASSERLGKEGSVYTDVEVPDFASAPVSLSGVLLESNPGLLVAPIDALTAIAPVVPTTLRDFTMTHRAIAFLTVYQGGRGAVSPVTMKARILDATNRTVVEATSMLVAAQFGAPRAADYQYQLPLTHLAPGPHLLRLEATRGTATARRDIRFTLR
jgi:VWFA-related protein